MIFSAGSRIHTGQPVLSEGVAPGSGGAGMILLHGRGASAAGMLDLAREFNVPGFTFLAPQAAGSVWYPRSFLAPPAENEPWLSSALGVVAGLVDSLSAAGIPRNRIVVLGFSQGACLALEFALQHPGRYGGVIGLSGALITPPPSIDPDDLASLDGTPVFLGCSRYDPHIPLARVEESARLFGAIGGGVTLNLYPNAGHTINEDEIDEVRHIMTNLDGVRAPHAQTGKP